MNDKQQQTNLVPVGTRKGRPCRRRSCRPQHHDCTTITKHTMSITLSAVVVWTRSSGKANVRGVENRAVVQAANVLHCLTQRQSKPSQHIPRLKYESICSTQHTSQKRTRHTHVPNVGQPSSIVLPPSLPSRSTFFRTPPSAAGEMSTKPSSAQNLLASGSKNAFVFLFSATS